MRVAVVLRSEWCTVWVEPFTTLRLQKIFNLLQDNVAPFQEDRRASHYHHSPCPPSRPPRPVPSSTSRPKPGWEHLAILLPGLPLFFRSFGRINDMRTSPLEPP